MVYIQTYVLLLLFCVSSVYAQKASSNKRAQSSFLEASKALQQHNYSKAESLLLQATVQDPTFATAYQQLADIYRKNERYQEAVKTYLLVLQNDSNLTPLTHFGLGEALLFTGSYLQAQQQLNSYKRKTRLSGKSLQLVDKYLADCAFSLQQQNQASLLRLTLLPNSINTEHEEYFPKLTADNKTIVFTRKENNQENFYESQLLGENEWSEAVQLDGQINSTLYNEGAHCISPDGKYLFFTGCNWPNGLGSCDIYVSKKENGKWQTPHNLGAPINSRGWESQPAISADGRTLYFVSNKPGGYGGYDIYKSLLLPDGQWSAPQNLGPQINTAFDESAPYIHADGQTLYFASNGWPGYGQKDIYSSKIDSLGNWGIPKNLGQPINNFLNQTSFHISMNGKIGHLSSQDSTGRMKIFSFEMPKDSRPTPVAYILGTIKDKNTEQALNATISVTAVDKDSLIFQDESDYADGTFLAVLPIGHTYAVHIQREGYLFESQQYALDNPKHTDEQFESTIFLKPITLGAGSTLNNIYFDVNKYELLPSSQADLFALISFLNINKGLTIEIEGHTDNTGDADHNMQLSEKRALSVKDYLIQQGIKDHRIFAKGYGSSAPVATNETEKGRQLNRRTAFKILKMQ